MYERGLSGERREVVQESGGREDLKELGSVNGSGLISCGIGHFGELGLCKESDMAC